MKIRSLAIAVAVLATTPAFANGPAPKVAEPQAAPRTQTVLEEVATGMRDILRAVSPEIALPAIEVKLPTLAPRRG